MIFIIVGPGIVDREKLLEGRFTRLGFGRTWGFGKHERGDRQPAVRDMLTIKL